MARQVDAASCYVPYINGLEIPCKHGECNAVQSLEAFCGGLSGLAQESAGAEEAVICTPSFLDLPFPVIQYILVSAGSAGALAATACVVLRNAFANALACPELAARFLMARYSRDTVLFHVYGSSAFRERLLRGLQGPHAASKATESLIVELLNLGAALQPQARFLLSSAAGCGDAGVVRTLLRCGVDAAGCGGRALVAASSSGHLPVMELLLRAGVSARAENGMPLRAACKEGQAAAAQLLLSHGADPRVAGGAALVEASRGGHLELVLELLAAGTDPRVGGSQALGEAAAAGHGTVVLALLAAGAQPTARNSLAVRLAQAAGHGDVVRMLQMAATQGPVGSGATASAPAGCPPSASPAPIAAPGGATCRVSQGGRGVATPSLSLVSSSTTCSPSTPSLPTSLSPVSPYIPSSVRLPPPPFAPQHSAKAKPPPHRHPPPHPQRPAAVCGALRCGSTNSAPQSYPPNSPSIRNPGYQLHSQLSLPQKLSQVQQHWPLQQLPQQEQQQQLLLLPLPPPQRPPQQLPIQYLPQYSPDALNLSLNLLSQHYACLGLAPVSASAADAVAAARLLGAALAWPQ